MVLWRWVTNVVGDVVCCQLVQMVGSEEQAGC